MVGGIINGISNLIGSGIQAGVQASENQKNRDFNAEQARLAREFNASEAQKTREWQEEMSNTSYQRAMNDMQAAGINPAMAFSNGSAGASTPSGASASGSNASASGQGTINVANVINSAANLTHAFNSDKNSANDINRKQLADMVKNLAYIMGRHNGLN